MKPAYICLIISIIGIFSLLLTSLVIAPIQVSSYQELKENSYVQVSGKIISISSYNDFSIIKLDNNITLTCNCKLKENSTIQVLGKVISYKNMLEIQVEEIKNVS